MEENRLNNEELHEEHEHCCCHSHEHHEENHKHHGEECHCHEHEHHHEHGEECHCHDSEHHHEHGEECHCHDSEHHHEHGEECHCHEHEHHHEEEGDGTCSCCGIEHKHSHDETCSCCGVEHGKKSGARLVSLQEWLTLGISLAVLIVSFVLHKLDVFKGSASWTAVFDPAWVAVVLCGKPIFTGAYKNLKKKKITSALLISIAMVASIVMGLLTIFGMIGESGDGHDNYLFAAGEVAFLMAIGETIEGITVGKTKNAVGALISLKPTKALLKVGEGYEEIDAAEIKVGDIVLIRPYDAVSVDGIIVSGESAVDESGITGESKPVDKAVGDSVYQGTKNFSSAFEVQVTRLNSETTLSKLIQYVKTAEQNKAPIVKLADKWAGYIVPFACVTSVIVFFVTKFGFDVPLVEAFRRAINILVVVCPCALALATPIAISAGIGNASRKGILIKNGIALEALAKVDTICFDKTGTLTKGELKVADIEAAGCKHELMRLAKAAEEKSEHPIAKAILAYGEEVGYEAESTESITGIGVKAIVNGKTVLAVKPKHVDMSGANWYHPEAHKDATTVIIVADGTPLGAIYVTDTVREEAKTTISELNEKYKTVMLTGDNEGSAAAVARAIGIGETKANLLPEGKVEAIKALQQGGKKVLMLGDGVNDAPALATGDCSLAMGAMGSPVAIETADISLMTEDIGKIPFLMKLAKHTLNIIRFNIILSLSISLAAVIVSAFGHLPVEYAALVHNAGSVFVSTNSALLLLYKGKRKITN